MQLGEVEHCQQIIDDNIAFKIKEIQEAHEEACDEDWTELDKQERIVELQAEKEVLQQLFKQLQQRVVPAFDYELYPTSSCYFIWLSAAWACGV